MTECVSECESRNDKDRYKKSSAQDLQVQSQLSTTVVIWGFPNFIIIQIEQEGIASKVA